VRDSESHNGVSHRHCTVSYMQCTQPINEVQIVVLPSATMSSKLASSTWPPNASPTPMTASRNFLSATNCLRCLSDAEMLSDRTALGVNLLLSLRISLSFLASSFLHSAFSSCSFVSRCKACSATHDHNYIRSYTRTNVMQL
jgi:hypothetical protein